MGREGKGSQSWMANSAGAGNSDNGGLLPESALEPLWYACNGCTGKMVFPFGTAPRLNLPGRRKSASGRFEPSVPRVLGLEIWFGSRFPPGPERPFQPGAPPASPPDLGRPPLLG